MQLNTMVESVSKRVLPTLILLSALSVSGSAAFYSVSGLSKLFAGAAFEVMVMAGSLEAAKLVTATLLHRYWKTLSNVLKIYLTLAVIVLVLITSMGIYGFLSAAYQDTFNKLMQRDNKVAFLQEKADFYQSDVTRYEKELEQISNNIATLSNAKATSIQVRDTTVAGGVRSTVSTAELRLSQARITSEEANRRGIRAKRDQVADSLQKYQLEILQLKSDTDVAGELGPLEYLSGLTGTPMDVIINILLLVIVFVFDPLAVSLIIAANFAFAQLKPRKDDEEPSTKSTQEEVTEVPEPRLFNPQRYEGAEWLPDVEDEQEEFLEAEAEKPDAVMYPEREMSEEELEKLYAIYGETGSIDPKDLEVDYETVEAPDWEVEAEQHPDFEDAQKNIILEESDTQKQIKDLESYLRKERVGGINPRLEKDLTNQINKLNKKLQQEDDDDLTLTY